MNFGGFQVCKPAIKVFPPLRSMVIVSRCISNQTRNPETSILNKVKSGLKHYYDGSKQLVKETKASCSILKKILAGRRLLRREYFQLVKTGSDLVRLVPFVIIMVVPFLEFALPVILKFFPNMLPSTYESKLQAEEKLRKRLKVRIETAKFLQDMVVSLSRNHEPMTELNEILQAKDGGNALSTQDIVDMSNKLANNFKLESMQRPMLLGLCKFLGLSAFGTENYLRYQIQKVMSRLRKDDELILEERIDTLTFEELCIACDSRNIVHTRQDTAEMQAALQQWLELHLSYKVPTLFLIFFKAVSQTSDPARHGLITNLSEGMEKHSASHNMVDTHDAHSKMYEKNVFQTTEFGDGKDLRDISTAIVDLISPAPDSKIQLEELKKNIEYTKPQYDAEKNLELAVEKIVKHIEDDLMKLEQMVKDRLDKIKTTSDGYISTIDLESLLRLVRICPKSYTEVQKLIAKFDEDSDGKIFIDELLKISKSPK